MLNSSVGRQIAVKALAHLKAARAANGGKLGLEPWLDALGEAIDAGIEEHFEREPSARIPRKSYDALFDTLATSCGFRLEEMTHAAKKEVAVALAALKKIHPLLLPQDLTQRASAYKAKWPTRELTPNGLSKWWSQLSPAKAAIDIYQEPPPIWRQKAAELFPHQAWVAKVEWEYVRSTHGRQIWAALG